MKRNKLIHLLGILAVAGCLTSCLDESGFEHQEGGVLLTFSADVEKEPASKTTLDASYSLEWEDGDELGVFIDNAQTPTVNALGTASVNNSTATYSATVSNYSSGDKLYAYYPYADGAERDGHKVRLSIEPKQTQTSAGVLNGKNFPMVAAPYTFVSDASAGEEPFLNFKHLAAFIEFDVYAAESACVGEKVLSVEFRTSSVIAGAFQFDYTAVNESKDFSIVSEGSSTSVTVTLDEPASVTSSKGRNKLYMAIKPGKYSASVLVTTDRGVYMYPIPNEACVFERAYVRRFSLGLAEDRQVNKSTFDEYTENYIRAHTNTYKKVYFDFETASNYAATDVLTSEDRKKTDLVLFSSSNSGLCFAAPACSDLSNFKKDGIIDCNGWNTDEKNKTKIMLLSDFTEDDYNSLTPVDMEALTEGWENKNETSYHRQNKITKDTYYGFKTVQMDASGNVAEVVSCGVMKITGVNTNSAATRCVVFDYKITQSSSTLDNPAVVTVSGGKIMVDGAEFTVKGVAANNFHAKAAEIGANTLRVYNMSTTTMGELGYILDEAWMNDLKVCVGLYMFPWNQNGVKNFYDENYTASVAKLRTHVKNIVGAYRNHPAVLMWCIGNECDSSYDGSENLSASHHMWNVINEFAELIKSMDSNHPVTTCLANAANMKYVKDHCGSLDLLMVNSYGSAIANLPNHLSSWTKPFVVGEFAHAGTWQMGSDRQLPWNTTAGKSALIELTSTQKAKEYADAWNDVMDAGAEGGFAFQWGYQTHGEVLTWFGMHDRNGNAFGVVDELQRLWTGSDPYVMAPVIEDRSKMKMNGKRADDKVTVTPSMSCTAYVEASSPSGSTLTYEWRIVEENTAASDGSLLDGIAGLIADPSKASISFSAPSVAGAYRLYVFVHDESAEKLASACIPFSVTD